MALAAAIIIVEAVAAAAGLAIAGVEAFAPSVETPTLGAAASTEVDTV
jgi:hypothetical protein